MFIFNCSNQLGKKDVEIYRYLVDWELTGANTKFFQTQYFKAVQYLKTLQINIIIYSIDFSWSGHMHQQTHSSAVQIWHLRLKKINPQNHCHEQSLGKDFV